MFDLSRKKQQQQTTIRDVLFGDAPFNAWPDESSTPPQDEPWLSFVHAREQLSNDDTEGAKDTLRRILAMPDLESRHYLQS